MLPPLRIFFFTGPFPSGRQLQSLHQPHVRVDCCMPKPKSRFVVTTGGKPRLLMSIRELADKSLAIIPRSSEYHMDRDVDRPSIVEHHYSVHNSPRANLNTFNDTVTLNDGRKKYAKFFSEAIYNDKFCFLFSRSVPNVILPHFDVVSRPRDRVVNLGEYDCTRTTLVYSAIVSRAGKDLRTLPNWRAHVKYIDFELYRVSLIYSLLNLSSPYETAIMMSTSFDIDAPPDAKPIHPLDQGEDWQQTTYDHFGSVNEIRRQLIKYIDHRSQALVPDEELMRVD